MVRHRTRPVNSMTLEPPPDDPRSFWSLEQLYKEDKITGEDLVSYIERIDICKKMNVEEMILEKYWDDVDSDVDDSELFRVEW